MPLPKPNKGDPLNSADFRQSSAYSEANTPRPGLGIRVRRTVGGSSISLSPAKAAAASGSDSDSGGAGEGLPDGAWTWGRVEYDKTNHKLIQFKDVWSAADGKFVESATATNVVNGQAESHSSQHGGL